MELSAEIDRIMEQSAGYLSLSCAAEEREGEVMIEDMSDTEPPQSVVRFKRGITTGAGITIQVDEYDDDSGLEEYPNEMNETSV